MQLYEPFTDQEGNLCSRPVYRDGLIEKLAWLPPVPGALDQ
ncbi:hypothetical protein ACVWZK_002747 [Bradyrhizobium sp. GM0.4]